MKKRLAIVLALVLTFGMAFAACGNNNAPAAAPPADSGSAGSSAAAPEATPPADPDEVYDFIVTVTLGETVSPNWARLLNELEEESGGRLDVTVYWSGSLISIPEIPKGIQSGAAMFGNLPTPNYPDVLPLSTCILSLPFMGLQDPVGSAEIYMQLLDEFPELMAELEQYDMYPLAATTLGMYDMHFTDTNPVKLPSDLDGRQIVPYKLEFLPMLEANNAAGSYIPPGQIYESLEKGVVNGYINNWAFQGWFGLTELVKQHVAFGDYGAFHEWNVLVVNKTFYDGLPADLQQLLTDKFRTNGGYKDLWQDTADLVASEQEKAEAKGDLMYQLTEEELQAWKDALGDTHEAGLAKIAEQTGSDICYDIYDRALELIAEKWGA